jgi:hypothetical protein
MHSAIKTPMHRVSNSCGLRVSNEEWRMGMEGLNP